VLAFAAIALVFAWGASRQMPDADLRTLVFVTLVTVNVSLILANRTFSASLLSALLRRNASLWVLLAGVATVLAIAIAWEPARNLFRFGPLTLADLGAALLAGLAVLLLLEAVKPRWRAAFRA